jgi:hypothetical protein
MKYCDYCKKEHPPIHADFDLDRLGDVIWIRDLNLGNRSVTNDVEYVLWFIQEYPNRIGWYNPSFNIADFKIVYKDTDGRYDGIRLKDKKFDGFYPLTTRNLIEAIKAVGGKL